MIRFWRGVRDATKVDEAAFRLGVNTQLIPQTPIVSAHEGLYAYLPVMLGNFKFDECALVIYAGDTYNAIRTTPKGKAYGDLHGDFFDMSKSKSLLPEDHITGQAFQLNHAYALTAASFDFQKASVTFKALTRRVTGTDDLNYLTAAETALSQRVSLLKNLG